MTPASSAEQLEPSPDDTTVVRGISPGAPLTDAQIAENLRQDQAKFAELTRQKSATPSSRAAAVATSNYLGIHHSAQANWYYCGPAAVRSALLHRNVNVTQAPLAVQMKTTDLAGTAWTGVNADVPSPSGRPVRDVLNAREPRSWNYAAVDVPNHTSETQSSYRSKLTFNINANHALVAGVYEHLGEANLNGHPINTQLWHYVSLRGYSDSGSTSAVDDPVSGSSISWAVNVPAQSNIGSAKMIKMMEPHNGQGAYGYVW